MFAKTIRRGQPAADEARHRLVRCDAEVTDLTTCLPLRQGYFLSLISTRCMAEIAESCQHVSDEEP